MTPELQSGITCKADVVRDTKVNGKKLQEIVRSFEFLAVLENHDKDVYKLKAFHELKGARCYGTLQMAQVCLS